MAFTVSQKLTKAMLDLKEISPYYSAIFQVMEQESSEEVELISISVDKIYYHPVKIAQLPLGELLFWILHSIAHIALGHLLRRQQREADLWNLACDFYVNKLLATEFHLACPGDQVQWKGVSLAMPLDIAFSRDLNLETDYVEAIYKKLKSNRSQSQEETPSKNSSAPLEDSKETWKNQWEDGERGTHPTCSHSHDFLEGEEEELTTFLQELATGDFSEKINGADLLDKDESQLKKQRKSDRILGEAQLSTSLQQENRPGGQGEFSLEKECQQQQNPPLDWRKLLRRYLRVAQEKEASFSHPDKRFFYQNRIMPGEAKEELDGLQGLKICLDTSGSITPEQLQEFMSQVWGICKEFHLDGELIYWDTIVESASDFQGMGDWTLFRPHQGQGTNPDCLFSYFESRKCKIQPVVTLIFTDGYVRNTYVNAKRKKRFKNTIWVISQAHASQFQPGFGQVVKPIF